MHNAKVKLCMASESKMVVEWPFRENGAERIYTNLVKVGLCNLKYVLKLCINRSKWDVCSKKTIE